MAISRNLKSRSKPRYRIILISLSAAAITFLFILYSSSSSFDFSFSSPKALKNLLRDRKQMQSLDKYLYWGDRIDCPGKHCDSCEGLGHQESSLRCALEEALFLQRYFSSLFSYCILVVSNYDDYLEIWFSLMGDWKNERTVEFGLTQIMQT